MRLENVPNHHQLEDMDPRAYFYPRFGIGVALIGSMSLAIWDWTTDLKVTDRPETAPIMLDASTSIATVMQHMPNTTLEGVEYPVTPPSPSGTFTTG